MDPCCRFWRSAALLLELAGYLTRRSRIAVAVLRFCDAGGASARGRRRYLPKSAVSTWRRAGIHTGFHTGFVWFGSLCTFGTFCYSAPNQSLFQRENAICGL